MTLFLTDPPAEEHHISGFDAATFFRLHDYESTGLWTGRDILRTYGLLQPPSASSPPITPAKKDMLVSTVLKMFDTNHDSAISLSEFETQTAAGVQLPDFGFGPGHHGDDEYEYEIHHWEKYHSGDDVREEDLTHPEDLEHFRLHEENEKKQEEWEREEMGGVVERNIPGKFRRG